MPITVLPTVRGGQSQYSRTGGITGVAKHAYRLFELDFQKGASSKLFESRAFRRVVATSHATAISASAVAVQ